MAKIGYVHLKVRDVRAAEAFYHRFLGFEVVERVGKFSFLSASDTHHDIALQHIGPQAPLASQHTVGLSHTAFSVSDKTAFAQTYRMFKEAGMAINAVDEGIAWALNSADPSGNGVKVYVDTRGEADGVAFWKGRDKALSEAQILSILDVALV